MNSNATFSLTSSEKTQTKDNFAITIAPLSLEEIYALADEPANGAVVVMSGMVRDRTDGKPVISLEYQAYQPMALSVFKQIATEIRDRWQEVNRVVIHHRIGRLQIGEISVLVAVRFSPPFRSFRGLSLRHRHSQTQCSYLEKRTLGRRFQHLGKYWTLRTIRTKTFSQTDLGTPGTKTSSIIKES